MKAFKQKSGNQHTNFLTVLEREPESDKISKVLRVARPISCHLDTFYQTLYYLCLIAVPAMTLKVIGLPCNFFIYVTSRNKDGSLKFADISYSIFKYLLVYQRALDIQLLLKAL